MTIPIGSFVTWVLTQRVRRNVTGHIAAYVAEHHLVPTKKEVASLRNAMYTKLRQSKGRDFPMIIYTSVARPTTKTDIVYSDSGKRDLQIVGGLIDKSEKFQFPSTVDRLRKVNTALAKAPEAMRQSVDNSHSSLDTELAFKQLQLDNEREIARSKEESNNDLRAQTNDLRLQLAEVRRDKVFAQQQLMQQQESTKPNGELTETEFAPPPKAN